MAHVGGLYHAFLGLFDANGNLLTSPIKFTEDDWHNITPEDGHFGGDKGSFAFYDCKGIKYILSVAGGCPNGSCCDDSPNLYKIENGKFKNIEDGINIDGPASKNPWKVTTSGNRLIIKTVPKASDNDCMETDYKDLTWNGEDCRFE
jgi:hypothetical protein